MKYLLILYGLILCFNVQAQMMPTPDLEWRMVHHPTNIISTAAGMEVPATPPGTAQNKEDSGEDWWYDIESYETEEEQGYFVSGFATWVNIELDETVAIPSGLFPANNGIANCNRPIMSDETLSQKLATIAKYSEDGEMIWCKPICKSEEGAISLTPALDGGYYFTGWGKATITTHGTPLKYNPRASDPGFDMTDSSVPFEGRKAKMIVGKISFNGEIEWVNAYGYYDMGGILSDSEVLGVSTIGYDLVTAPSGITRVVGYSQDLDDIVIGSNGEPTGALHRKIFIIDIDENGNVVEDVDGQIKRLVGLDNMSTEPREIEMNIEEESYYITGYQKPYGQKSDAILFKINEFLVQERIGNDPWNAGGSPVAERKALVRHAYPAEGNSIGWDVKRLKDGKIAWAFIEKCSNCLSSGNNMGQAKIILFDEDNLPGTKFINLQGINTVGFSEVIAFDMKMGLINTEDGGFACVTSVKGNEMPEQGMQTDVLNHLDYDIGYNCIDGEDIDGDGEISIYDEKFNYHEIWDTDSYVAKFDAAGDLLWDKQFDADDDWIEYYPGDYKQQECVYRIAENSEGALAIVGNASFNKDDYFIAKIESDCNTVYDVTPDAENKYYITSDDIWDSTPPEGILKIRGEVHIKSGYTLTIDGITVEFADSRKCENPTKVIVEPGAKLVLENGAILRGLSHCGNTAMWDGIEVWGNKEASQSSSNQGWVVMRESTIEDAHLAINLMRPSHWDQTGGVVQAYNSFFRNNRRSIAFMSYIDETTSGIKKPNRSMLRNVDFIWDNDFRHKPLNHVSLYKVYGVPFSGCHFSDNRTDEKFTSPYLESESVTKCGIQSIDAHYYVNAACNDIDGCTGDIEMEPWNASSFDNLDFGIYAASSSCIFPIHVQKSIFTNNLFGIDATTINDVTLIQNRFYFSEINNYYMDDLKCGIKLEYSQRLNVEENHFTNTSMDFETVGLCYGIVCENLGDYDEMIRKNWFTRMNIGNLTKGDNRGSIGPGYPDGSVGLSFECNENEDNLNDFKFTGTSGLDGIRLEIGDYGHAAENTFSFPSEGHLINETPYHVQYNYDEDGPVDHIPSLNTPILISTYATSNENVCQSNYTGKIVGFAALESSYFDLKQQIETLQSNSNSQQKVMILHHEMTAVLRSIFEYLFSEKELNILKVEEWLQHSDNHHYNLKLIDFYIQESNFSMANQQMEQLKSVMKSFPEQLRLDLQDYLVLKKIIISNMSKAHSFYDLSPVDKATIESIASGKASLASYQAQEILCFFFDQCSMKIPEHSDAQVDEKMNTRGDEEENTTLNLTAEPNPINDHIILHIHEVKPALIDHKFEVINVQGQIVLKGVINAQKTLVNFENLSNGMYLIRIYNETTTKTIKVMKQ